MEHASATILKAGPAPSMRMHAACRLATLLVTLLTCATLVPPALAGGIPDHVGLKVKGVGGVCLHRGELEVETTDCAAGTSYCLNEDLVCVIIVHGYGSPPRPTGGLLP